VLGPAGVALVGARNDEARGHLIMPPSSLRSGGRSVDYYELFDLLSVQFPHVRMIGVVPFLGVALAELGLEEEPEVTVDTQLAGDGEPPELFLALASEADTRLAEYAIVQLPVPSMMAGAPASSSEDATHDESDEAARTPTVSRRGQELTERERVALAEAQLRARVLEAQLAEFQNRSSAADDADRQRRALELEASLAIAHAQLREAQVRAAEIQDRADALELAFRAADEDNGVLRGRILEAVARVEMGEEQVASLAIALDEARRSRVDPEELARLKGLVERAADAEARAAAMEAELGTIAEAHAGELVQLETVLRERGQALKALEAELGRRERMIHELVAAVEEHASSQVHAEAGPPGPVRELEGARAELDALQGELEVRTRALQDAGLELDRARSEAGALKGKLDALALEVARREGEITSRGWRITELEQALTAGLGASAKVPERTPAPDPARVARAEDELSALRQALTQEHAARTRAESGEELTKARAELARQAALIEQLSRELDGQDRRRIDQESGRA
jgi:hypothetical protein